MLHTSCNSIFSIHVPIFFMVMLYCRLFQIPWSLLCHYNELVVTRLYCKNQSLKTDHDGTHSLVSKQLHGKLATHYRSFLSKAFEILTSF